MATTIALQPASTRQASSLLELGMRGVRALENGKHLYERSVWGFFIRGQTQARGEARQWYLFLRRHLVPVLLAHYS
jgi:hypothetical protein